MNPREVLRTIPLVVGVFALAIAGLMTVVTDLAAQLPFSFGAVGLLGIITAVMGIYQGRVRMRSSLHESRMPSPEFPIQVPAPGSDIDRMLVQAIEERHGTIEYRERIRERMRHAAVSVIMYQMDCSEAEAVAHLENGSWTDDDVAAGFFSDQAAISAGSETLVERWFGLGGGGNEFTDILRQTVRAIVDLSEIEVDFDEEASRGNTLVERLGFGGDDEEETARTAWYPEWYLDVADLEPGGVREIGVQDTNQWRGISAFTLVVAGVGILVNIPGLLLAGAVGMAYAIQAQIADPPNPSGLQISRTVSDENPDPGDEIDVTVTVENNGSSLLPDLRLVDTVPQSMIVVDGSVRHATALRPGDSAQFNYTVRVERGEHTWPVFLVARDASGSTEREVVVKPETGVRCLPSLRTPMEMPVRAQTSQYSGDVSTQTGGAGLELYSVRDYRHGDPMNRVDWNHLARTGELATVEFREEKTASVTLLFDTRSASFLAPEPGEQHAIEPAIAAANEVFASLFDAGNLVGVAAFDTVPLWLSPGAGAEQLERARLLFANHPALSPVPPERMAIEDQGGYVDPMTHVRRQLPQNTQIVLFSPLCDDYSAEVARRLDSAGHLVTIVSPDPTNNKTIGENLARVERAMRINFLREQGLRIVDWDYSESLVLEIERARARWTA